MLPFLNGSTFGFSLENKWCHLLMYHTWAGHLCEIKKAKLIVKDKQKTQPGKCEKHAFIFFVAFLRCSQTLAQLPLAQVCVHTYIWMGFSIFILIILIFFFFLQSYGLVLFYRSCPGAAIWNKNVCIHFLINRLIVIQPAAAKWQNRCNDEN